MEGKIEKGTVCGSEVGVETSKYVVHSEPGCGMQTSTKQKVGVTGRDRPFKVEGTDPGLVYGGGRPSEGYSGGSPTTIKHVGDKYGVRIVSTQQLSRKGKHPTLKEFLIRVNRKSVSVPNSCSRVRDSFLEVSSPLPCFSRECPRRISDSVRRV